MYMIINGFYIVVVAFIGLTAQVFGWSLCFIFVLSFVFRSFEVCIPSEVFALFLRHFVICIVPA